MSNSRLNENNRFGTMYVIYESRTIPEEADKRNHKQGKIAEDLKKYFSVQKDIRTVMINQYYKFFENLSSDNLRTLVWVCHSTEDTIVDGFIGKEGTIGGKTVKEFIDKFTFDFSRIPDKTIVEDIYFISSAIGFGNNSLAHQIAKGLSQNGFTNVKVHAISNPNGKPDAQHMLIRPQYEDPIQELNGNANGIEGFLFTKAEFEKMDIGKLLKNELEECRFLSASNVKEVFDKDVNTFTNEDVRPINNFQFPKPTQDQQNNNINDNNNNNNNVNIDENKNTDQNQTSPQLLLLNLKNVIKALSAMAKKLRKEQKDGESGWKCCFMFLMPKTALKKAEALEDVIKTLKKNNTIDANPDLAQIKRIVKNAVREKEGVLYSHGLFRTSRTKALIESIEDDTFSQHVKNTGLIKQKVE